jgi:hypothetical protein
VPVFLSGLELHTLTAFMFRSLRIFAQRSKNLSETLMEQSKPYVVPFNEPCTVRSVHGLVIADCPSPELAKIVAGMMNDAHALSEAHKTGTLSSPESITTLARIDASEY